MIWVKFHGQGRDTIIALGFTEELDKNVPTPWQASILISKLQHHVQSNTHHCLLKYMLLIFWPTYSNSFTSSFLFSVIFQFPAQQLHAHLNASPPFWFSSHVFKTCTSPFQYPTLFPEGPHLMGKFVSTYEMNFTKFSCLPNLSHILAKFAFFSQSVKFYCNNWRSYKRNMLTNWN